MAESENEFEFKNLETGHNIKFTFDKQFIVIYGKNGCGKTTFSRNEKFDKKFVFNSDFINKNVYIVDSNGAKPDSTTKEGFSSLWFSESIVSLKKELEVLSEQKKQIETKISEKNAEISEKFNTFDFTLHLQEYLNMCNSLSVPIPKDNKWADEINKFKCPNPLTIQIKNDDEVKAKIVNYKNNVGKEMFVNCVKSSGLLKSLLIDKNDNETKSFFNAKTNYENDLIEINKIYKSFKTKNANDEREWIQKALELHKEIDYCLFCKNENITKIKSEWKEIIESKANQSKSLLLSIVKKYINELKPIVDRKEENSKLFPKTTNFICKLDDKFIKIQSLISSNLKFDIDEKFFNHEVEDLLCEAASLNASISNYLFKEFYDSFIYLNLINKAYKDAIIQKQNELDEEMNKNAESIGESINSRLKKLNFDKELSVKVESRSGKKYVFAFKNGIDVGILSDGQKHKLALAIFLESISKYDLTDKTVVIDDPVITLDFKTYYSVKEEIKNLTAVLNVKHLILLTHNITFLHLQMSDFFNKDNPDAKMYRLFGNGAELIDINTINYDDITLYKSAFCSITNEYEFNLVANMNLRLFRYFLDLKCRIEGIPDSGDPSRVISKISIGKADKTRLNKINSEITSKIRDTNSTNENLVYTFKLLKESLDIMGFPSVISDADISKISLYSNNNVRLSNGNCSKFIFDILSWIYELFNSKNSNYDDIKNYMNHPRQQLTKTLIALDFSDDDGKFFI